MALRYCTIEGLRQKCLNDRDNATRDAELTELGEKFEDKLDNAIFPHTTVPLTGDDIDGDVIDTAECGAAAQFHRQVDNTERSKEYLHDWEEGIKRLQKKYRATPTERTKSVLVGQDPRDAKLALPMQSSIFAFDDYA